jgi:HTH-type transcriptional regulator/antitoxin HipB
MDQIARTAAQLGAALRRRRKQLSLSQDVLGGKIHLRQATISHVEAGDPGTKLGTLFDLLSALDLELVVRPRSKGKAADIEDIF